MSARLKQKVSRLENSLRFYSATVFLSKCTCRGIGRSGWMTRYHTSDELEKILYVPCPVHGLRDPGPIWFQPRSEPLEDPDWDYCTCPPDPWRDYVMGKRPRPTQDELIQHANEHLGDKSDFEEESRRIKEIIETFKAKFEQARGRKLWE